MHIHDLLLLINIHLPQVRNNSHLFSRDLKEKYKTYRRRWFVLGVFSMACFLQAAIWNTWGPITQSAEVVFGWEDSQIGMLANWGNIAYIFTVFPACYFMDTKGNMLITGR